MSNGTDWREKAGYNLEGSGRHSSEGLADSRRPCARGLSVAGLLGLLTVFPGWEGLFPEVRKGLFPPPCASLLQHPD